MLELITNRRQRLSTHEAVVPGDPTSSHPKITPLFNGYSANGDVVTSSSPAANNVNLLVQTVLLNYMALHDDVGRFNQLFGSALGTGTALDGMVAFSPIAARPTDL